MKKIKPFVTVLVSVYNAEIFLKEAINSVLNQTFKDFELLMIDDGSVDKSLKVIKSYEDKRIKIVIHKNNRGLIFSLNEGLKLSRGKYIVRMDSDDISLPTRILEQVDFMEKNRQVVACGAWAEAIDENGVFMFKMKSPAGLLLKYNFWKPTPLIHPSVIMRKSMLKGFRFSKTATMAEDYDLWLRLNRRHKLFNLSKFLIRYRIHRKSISHKNRDMQLFSSYNSFKSILGIDGISFEQYKSLASLEFKLNPLERLKLLRMLSHKIDYPLWFALVDTFVYSLRKWFKMGRYYDA